MSVQYVNREGKPVTKEDWYAHYRNPEYNPVLHFDCGRTWEVEASWVGWTSSMEKRRCPFIVQAWRLGSETGPDGKEKETRVEIETISPRWCATPEEAHMAFVELLEQVA